ncbi:hypothetical protein DOE78_13510 [Bacillus sp. Y1]|nr:hypothetical protein [Bacillus sp. Y1]AYA76381.1 hypothetical protein DOE78_13510 [Bacillus sp. Y1]
MIVNHTMLVFITLITFVLYHVQVPSIFMFLIFVHLLLMFFLTEIQRIWVWMILSLFLGLLIMRYTDRFISELSFHQGLLFILSECLWLIPILFGKYITSAFKNPTLDKERQLQKARTRNILFLLVLVFFLLGIGTINGLNEWFRVLFYSLLVSQLKIYLSFGIFLSRLQTLTSRLVSMIGAAIIFTLPFTSLGYSLISLLIIGVTGLGYAWLVSTCKSLLPVYVVHSVLVFLFILAGGFPVLSH